MRNELPFDQPAVVAAIGEFGWFARNEDFVSGGVGAVATSDFRDSPAGLFSFPPNGMMHEQASFIPNFFPPQAEMGEDARFLYFPAYAGADLGQPMLRAGGLIAATAGRPVAHGFIEFLKPRLRTSSRSRKASSRQHIQAPTPMPMPTRSGARRARS